MASRSEPASPVDYLAIGHITRDVSPHGYQAGGTVLYSGRLATALGMRVGVVTSTVPDFDLEQALPAMTVVNIPAAHATTFENILTPSGRRQIIHSVAEPLTRSHIPDAWQETAIIHLAPLAGEIDETTVTACRGTFIGLTAQGLMRSWDADGHVKPCALRNATAILPEVDAVIVSQDDLVDAADLAHIHSLAPLVVLTQGAKGCTIYDHEAVYHVAAPSVTEVNPIGAGDIFAAAFFIRMIDNGRQVVDSAEYATQIAALSVTQPTPDTKIQAISRFVTQQTLQTTNT
ncbi:MAG: PfkB family carbohydrate kinase [Anaerolineae bacterium]|nr:PfkB family carbohydrate kinase [Anaerolineae bacterium]